VAKNIISNVRLDEMKAWKGSGQAIEIVVMLDETEYFIVFNWDGYFIPAVLNRPLENCSPAEGEINIEITGVFVQDEGYVKIPLEHLAVFIVKEFNRQAEKYVNDMNNG